MRVSLHAEVVASSAARAVAARTRNGLNFILGASFLSEVGCAQRFVMAANIPPPTEDHGSQIGNTMVNNGARHFETLVTLVLI
ncbi:hypothetical protein GCM10018962_77750 [Dactylosporangium matsuzakiense]|uniref:Uncharacterized protein n=1 Tax=Dactylosporangium matsuzakiense TaxID=53360 RepID=A0A9W6KQB2_9ACTN|nr:hypothetical protein GCM10017581_073350 [Dactylosporangium matsuzakiense]